MKDGEWFRWKMRNSVIDVRTLKVPASRMTWSISHRVLVSCHLCVDLAALFIYLYKYKYNINTKFIYLCFIKIICGVYHVSTFSFLSICAPITCPISLSLLSSLSFLVSSHAQFIQFAFIWKKKTTTTGFFYLI